MQVEVPVIAGGCQRTFRHFQYHLQFTGLCRRVVFRAVDSDAPRLPAVIHALYPHLPADFHHIGLHPVTLQTFRDQIDAQPLGNGAGIPLHAGNPTNQLLFLQLRLAHPDQTAEGIDTRRIGQAFLPGTEPPGIDQGGNGNIVSPVSLPINLLSLPEYPPEKRIGVIALPAVDAGKH